MRLMTWQLNVAEMARRNNIRTTGIFFFVLTFMVSKTSDTGLLAYA